MPTGVDGSNWGLVISRNHRIKVWERVGVGDGSTDNISGDVNSLKLSVECMKNY